MGCGFAVFLAFIGARIIVQGADSPALKSCCSLRSLRYLAHFAVKIFNREGRKVFAKVAKPSIDASRVVFRAQAVCYVLAFPQLERGKHATIRISCTQTCPGSREDVSGVD